MVLRNEKLTFVKNMKQPIHRWFRFSAGFNAKWASEVMKNINKDNLNILDPFVGTGTVVLESKINNFNSIGIEAHPFLYRLAKTKLMSLEINTSEFRKYAISILRKAKELKPEISDYPDLIKKSFSKSQIEKLDCLRRAWLSVADKSPLSELIWLTLASILRPSANVNTAISQYIQPKKEKSYDVSSAYHIFKEKVELIISDIVEAQKQMCDLLKFVDDSKKINKIVNEDARDCSSVKNDWVDLVITSPPYANNYDYADATRLELTFFGEIERWGDLHDAVRKFLIPACSHHVSRQKDETFKVLSDSILKPIYYEIYEKCKLLEEERENHGGRKTYHTMIAFYFREMAKVWRTLRRVAKPDSSICFIIGDSAPYGIHIPVEEWFGKLALSLGFKSYKFEKIRDRNIKWKNRKHNVPLHEGFLWVKG
ncbi:MAG: DNA methyltransferase [Candidatus Hermodarchaeota archaeon]